MTCFWLGGWLLLAAGAACFGAAGFMKGRHPTYYDDAVIAALSFGPLFTILGALCWRAA